MRPESPGKARKEEHNNNKVHRAGAGGPTPAPELRSAEPWVGRSHMHYELATSAEWDPYRRAPARPYAVGPPST